MSLARLETRAASSRGAECVGRLQPAPRPETMVVVSLDDHQPWQGPLVTIHLSRLLSYSHFQFLSALSSLWPQVSADHLIAQIELYFLTFVWHITISIFSSY